MTLGVIGGHHDFLPAEFCEQGRKIFLFVLARMEFVDCRISTNDYHWTIRADALKDEISETPITTLGKHGVIRIPDLQKLLLLIFSNGFEYYIANSFIAFPSAVYRALSEYKGCEKYYDDSHGLDGNRHSA